MGTMIERPFGPAVEEVPLPDAPLALVVAQVRFPSIASIITDEGFIGPFQEAIRDEYPVLRKEVQNAILLSTSGPVEQRAGSIWRFDQHPQAWQVSLAADFVSVSATVNEGRSTYTDSKDFLDRLSAVVDVLSSWLDPKICDRFGIRYVDRVTEPKLVYSLTSMLRGEVLGMSGVRSLSENDEDVTPVHGLADHSYRFSDESELHTRWAFLPPNATLDTAIEPVDTRSWVLDLDCYTFSKEEFSPDLVMGRAKPFCDRIYRFFRWAVGDDFLRAHGGTP